MTTTTTNCTTSLWLDAIENAMSCIQKRPPPQDKRDHHGGGVSSSSSLLESCLSYLTTLEEMILVHKELAEWDTPPRIAPPPMSMKQFKKQRQQTNNHNNNKIQTNVIQDDNPFAEFRNNDMEQQPNHLVDKDEDDGGDVVFYNQSLSKRRIMIRIVTAQSELYAYRASLCQRHHHPNVPPQWKLGAQLYQVSLEKLVHAIALADSEISRCWQHLLDAKELVEDAQVVDVAISFLATEEAKFLHAAQLMERALLQRLEPQWASRDEARNSIGIDRWNNNPRPKNEHRNKRIKDEQALKEVQAALEQLEQLDTITLKSNSQNLKHKLLQEPPPPLQEQEQQQVIQERYNGQRPTDLSRRVSFIDYPDPSTFGWIFTGSHNNVVEFFEHSQGSIKLDWYFTTGTLKTSMDHPKRGKTQLFASRVTPDIYVQVLQDPRAHTNVRYYTREQQQQQLLQD